MTKIALPNRNDVLIAFKALTIAPGLSAGARRVGGAILDHFNRRTGRCDPSVERLAALLDLNRATVLRATSELEAAELIRKISHGGRNHTASYQPDWSAFQRIMDTWSGVMKAGPKVAKMQRQQSQNCDVDGRKNATQTNLRTQLKNPEKNPAHAPKPAQTVTTAPRKRRKQPIEPQPQLPLMRTVDGGRTTSKTDAAREAAAKRLMTDLLQSPERYETVVSLISSEDYEHAVSAEMAKKGSGSATVYQLLKAANGGRQ